jgi:autotransporter passenger strand-loop-strand repeat protein
VVNSGGLFLGAATNAGSVTSAVVSGTMKVLAGGADTGDVVLAGATETVSSGGVTSAATVDKGATLSGPGLVFEGAISGALVGASINSGVNIDSGGVAIGVADSSLTPTYADDFVNEHYSY